MARRPAARAKPTREPRAESRGRAFFLEFLSVTLGVLLALVLEQAATSWRERQRVADLRLSMNAEIADYVEIFHLRVRADKCVTPKLDQLEAHLRPASAAGPVVNVGYPPYFFSSRGAWNSDATDQLARYLGADTVRAYGEIYQGMAEYAELSSAEQNAWVALRTLEGDEDSIGPDRRARLREAIAEARNEHRIMMAIAKGMTGGAARLGVKRNHSLDSNPIGRKAICAPLAGPPAQLPG
jgi:hypothetical protein